MQHIKVKSEFKECGFYPGAECLFKEFSFENFNNNLIVTIKQLQFINKINEGSEPVISWKAREVFFK